MTFILHPSFVYSKVADLSLYCRMGVPIFVLYETFFSLLKNLLSFFIIIHFLRGFHGSPWSFCRSASVLVKKNFPSPTLFLTPYHASWPRVMMMEIFFEIMRSFTDLLYYDGDLVLRHNQDIPRKTKR